MTATTHELTSYSCNSKDISPKYKTQYQTQVTFQLNKEKILDHKEELN